ncbi:MAG: NUDIX domain-containing protein [Minisyncoccota bacterium]
MTKQIKTSKIDMLEVVNQNDEVIGLETRGKVHRDGLLHREVHIWFMTPNREIIFQHRAKDKDTYPDKLDATVGGHVDPGMTYDDTAIKECEEETGMVIGLDKLKFVKKVFKKSLDEITGSINNTIRSQYVYLYEGNVGDLKVEQGKAVGFEACKADHVDVVALKTILKNNDAVVVSNRGVQDFLKTEKILVQIFEEGVLDVGDFHIEALSVAHERVLGPLPENTAYAINKKLLHPGDSLNPALFKFQGTPVLALPTIAPWNKRFEVAEFAEEMKPEIIIPIHDGFVKDFFLKGQDEIYGEYFGEREIIFKQLSGESEFIEI